MTKYIERRQIASSKAIRRGKAVFASCCCSWCASSACTMTGYASSKRSRASSLKLATIFDCQKSCSNLPLSSVRTWYKRAICLSSRSGPISVSSWVGTWRSVTMRSNGTLTLFRCWLRVLSSASQLSNPRVIARLCCHFGSCGKRWVCWSLMAWIPCSSRRKNR